jgi:topoisomerase-4 subunit A
MNTAGYGYISEFKNMVSNKKSGRAFMKLPNQAELLRAIKLRDDHIYIAAVSSIGRLLIFKIDELPILPKGKGNKIINIPTSKFLAKEEFMAHAQLFSLTGSLRIESGKRFLTLKLKDLENYISSRAKRGNMLPQGYRKVDRIIEEVENISTDEN